MLLVPRASSHSLLWETAAQFLGGWGLKWARDLPKCLLTCMRTILLGLRYGVGLLMSPPPSLGGLKVVFGGEDHVPKDCPLLKISCELLSREQSASQVPFPHHSFRHKGIFQASCWRILDGAMSLLVGRVPLGLPPCLDFPYARTKYNCCSCSPGSPDTDPSYSAEGSQKRSRVW